MYLYVSMYTRVYVLCTSIYISTYVYNLPMQQISHRHLPPAANYHCTEGNTNLPTSTLTATALRDPLSWGSDVPLTSPVSAPFQPPLLPAASYDSKHFQSTSCKIYLNAPCVPTGNPVVSNCTHSYCSIFLRNVGAQVPAQLHDLNNCSWYSDWHHNQ
jgi:hypothetical protein